MRALFSCIIFVVLHGTALGQNIAPVREDSLAISQKLNAPKGLALDKSGNLYFADAGNHRVCKIDKVTGMLTTVAGTGIAGFSGDGGRALDAQLNEPSGIYITKDGDLLIADGTIRKVSGQTGIITPLHFNSEGLGIQASNGFAIKNDEDLYAVAGSFFIQKANLKTNKLTWFTNITGGNCVAIDAAVGNLYIGFANSIKKVILNEVQTDVAPKEATGLAELNATTIIAGMGAGEPAHGNSQSLTFYKINCMASDLEGNIYFVAETDNGVAVYRINKSDESVMVVKNGTVGRPLLNNPTSLLFDKDGSCYATDNSFIKKVNFEHQTSTTVAGTGHTGIGVDYIGTRKKQVDSLNAVAARDARENAKKEEAKPVVEKPVSLLWLIPLVKIANDTTYTVLFWADWCGPCNARLNQLAKISDLFTGKSRFIIVHPMGSYKQPDQTRERERAIAKLNKTPIQYTYYSSKLMMKDSVDGHDITSIPVTMIYRNGKLLFSETGKFTSEEALLNSIKKSIR